MNYGFLIDNRSCIGCHACSTACKSENEVPVGVNRTWVKYTEVGVYPDARRSFQVTRCNHCANPPCATICPTAAMHQRDDGIVQFDSDLCIGCKACMQACPYDAIYLDPENHTAAKCHFCAHRVDVGLEPACVVVCPEHAILAGDLDDPASEISQVLAKNNVTVRKPEQGTGPKTFYIDGHDPAMHPTSTDVPKSFMFADVVDDPHLIGNVGPSDPQPSSQGLPSGGPIQVGGNMAEHMVQVSYTSRHQVQWHWPIPAYLVTKGAAAGIFLTFAAALAAGVDTAPLAYVVGGGLATLLMLVTTALLVYDLDRPDRFFYLLVRPQWRSWVARAAWILAGFSTLSGLWWALETGAWLGLPLPAEALRPWLALATTPFAVLTGTYTAFLFAQAEGRDLWQSPALPIQMGLQMGVLGTGAMAAVGTVVDTGMLGFSTHLFALFLGLYAVVTLVADVGIAQPSEVARRASRDILQGTYKQTYWFGAVGAGLVLPIALVASRIPAALPLAFLLTGLGIFAWSWALVMAPQNIPNS